MTIRPADGQVDRRAVLAGLFYFGNVFAVGFVLGVIRTFIIEPRVGHLTAIMVETPAMLAVSFDAAMRVIERLDVPRGFGPRLVMGGSAVTLLLLAEFLLGTILQRLTASVFFTGFTTLSGAISLGAFAIFAALPAFLGQIAQRNERARTGT